MPYASEKKAKQKSEENPDAITKKLKTPPVLLAAFFLLLALTAQGQTRLAQLASRHPTSPEILNSYGIEQANNGDLIGAITTWRTALDLDRHNVHLYNNIGSALKRLGHDNHAFAWYAAALQIKPVYWTYYNLAILYRDCGQTEEACWALGEALRLNPDFLQAKDLLNRVRANAAVSQAAEKQKTESLKAPVLPPEGRIAQRPGKSATTAIKPAKTTVKTTTVTRPTPRHSQPDETINIATDGGGQIFLTFDGGATDAGFDTIISSLRQHDVRCTFFLTGKFALKYPEKCRQLLTEGHEIANHSMNHPDMKNFSAEKISEEIAATEEAFQKVTGKRGAPFFRFPYGHQNKRVEGIVENLGYRPVYWHIDTIDWREDPVNTIIGRVKSKLRKNSVILMHLGSKNGALALDSVLQHIKARGYTFARLSDLDARQLAALP